MPRPAKIARVLLLLILFAASLFAQNFAITGATVFDGTGAEPRHATVLVRDGKITGVGANLAISANTLPVNSVHANSNHH